MVETATYPGQRNFINPDPPEYRPTSSENPLQLPVATELSQPIEIPGLSPKESLPIWQYKQQLEAAIKNHSTIILAAGTGTGKTRGGSQIALEALGPEGQMIVTQNLRRATEESAKVIAADMRVRVGEKVGVQNRYTYKVSDETQLLFCPVQSLLIKMETDPLLQEYNLVAMDEVHKESKANELCMIKLRDIQVQRKAKGLPELKLMFISATADKEKLKQHFSDAVTVEIPAETHPVNEVFETSSIAVDDLPRKAAEKVKFAIDAGNQGNILVFLSGKAQIDEAGDALAAMGIKDAEIIRYYGAAPKDEQERLFGTSTKRKIVLATNAAQEALTLDINIEVDTGTHKHMELDIATGRQYLVEQKAPRDHLIQRRGRLGRKKSPYGQPDTYYALMTEAEWKSRPEHEAAEMQRTDLTQEMLILLAQGHDVHNFRYINPPPQTHIDVALRRLEKIGAYQNGKLTAKGELMAGLQLQPNLSSMVVSGIENGCAQQTSMLAAMLEAYPEAMEATRASLFKHARSDVLSYLEIFHTFNAQPKQKEWAQAHGFNHLKLRDAKELYDQLMRTIKEKRPNVNLNAPPQPDALDKSIFEGFADSVVTRVGDNTYRINGVEGQIDRTSVLSGQEPGHFVTFDLRIRKEDNGTMRRMAALNHKLPEALFQQPGKEIVQEKKDETPAPSSPIPPQKDNPPKAEIKTEAPAQKVEQTMEKEKTETPPPQLTPTQRLKAWFSKTQLGRFLKWLNE